MFENYISIGRSFVAEKNYLKALKFLKKAYACPEGKDDIDLILDLAFLYDKIVLPILCTSVSRNASVFC